MVTTTLGLRLEVDEDIKDDVAICAGYVSLYCCNMPRLRVHDARFWLYPFLGSATKRPVPLSCLIRVYALQLPNDDEQL